MKKESLRYIRKPWIGGNGTIYFGIPSKIANHLKLDQDDYLLVDVTDNLIVIKRHNPQFTKTELNKIQGYNNSTNNDKEELTVDESTIMENDFKNPLDDLDL
ncbi:MAG: hypothetical protein ACR2LL_03540 [Nitrosopumilus sp.]|uniref:hypothetical protein n=1 Tax=Nitrosopumilus sp. TaxID=2024843 RepID=UPI00292E12D6|nr:hypothetical protein [Nitrosopumilus sp.]